MKPDRNMLQNQTSNSLDQSRLRQTHFHTQQDYFPRGGQTDRQAGTLLTRLWKAQRSKESGPNEANSLNKTTTTMVWNNHLNLIKKYRSLWEEKQHANTRLRFAKQPQMKITDHILWPINAPTREGLHFPVAGRIINDITDHLKNDKQHNAH